MNRIRGSFFPPEWDYTSSAVTVYHRTNIVKITDDDGRIEYEYDEEQMSFSDFENTLYCKQLAKLNNLNGMCSGAIYQGVDIGTYHYNFSATTQTNLETIARRIDGGTTSILYRADNETEQRVYTASEMSIIINTKDEWIAVNANYYEKLKVWVNRETDETVVKSIHYGSQLPNDLMQELATKLASVGIDVTKYASLINP